MTATVPSELRMANDIARNLSHLPAERAAEEIAGHIARFWDPRMRARLREFVDAGAEGVDPLVAAAVRLPR
ncbi:MULTISPECIES: formate dehydrogenase subunit delta [unclassified Streptomyces]|uniref:formate dehydrogenase subunit delta n=1 Tax=unclassified Streptomyces TaxID=2593676 RepID=UPI0036EFB806